MNNFNKKIKAYFLDLDGTLLDIKNETGNYIVSKENKEAIKEVQESGRHIIISTGRIGKYVINLIKELNIDYAVTSNGAIIINKNGKVLKKVSLTIRQFLLLVDIAKEHSLVMKVDEELIGYGSASFFKKYITKKFGIIPANHYNCQMHTKHFKVIFWGKTKKSLLKIKELILQQVDDLSIETSAGGWTLEITHKNATKGLGNLFIADKLKIDKKNIVHVGDTMNDSTTAEHMKLIALKNASKKLKEVAHFIGPTWKNGGVAKVLKGEFEKIKRK